MGREALEGNDLLKRQDLMLTFPLSDVRGWLSLYKSTRYTNTSGSDVTIDLIDYTMPNIEVGVIRGYGSGVIGAGAELCSVKATVDGEQFPKSFNLDGRDYSLEPGMTNPILVQLYGQTRILIQAVLSDGFNGTVFGRVEGWYY